MAGSLQAALSEIDPALIMIRSFQLKFTSFEVVNQRVTKIFHKASHKLVLMDRPYPLEQ
jgi:hypothetical protein